MSSLEQLEQEMAAEAEVQQEVLAQRIVDNLDENTVVKKEKLPLWKLMMTRKVCAINVRFSENCECVRELYGDKNKFTLYKDGSVGVRIKLCPTCVTMNIDANDAHGKFYRSKESYKDTSGIELAAMKAEATEGKKEHWKLVMVRKTAGVQIRLSDWCKCANLLFNDKEKLTEHYDGSVTMRFKLCPICVHYNILANELVGNFAEMTAGQKRK